MLKSIREYWYVLVVSYLSLIVFHAGKDIKSLLNLDEQAF